MLALALALALATTLATAHMYVLHAVKDKERNRGVTAAAHAIAETPPPATPLLRRHLSRGPQTLQW